MTPSRPAVAGLAAAAFLAACFTHEVLGHAAACVAAGGTVMRLTSVVFQCRGSDLAADLGGPGANLAAAALCLVLLRGRTAQPSVRIALGCAFNAFWAAGCLLEAAVAARGDVALAARLAGHGAMPLRAVFGVGGAVLGVLACRPLRRLHWPRPAWRLAYGTAGLVACATALCFAGPALPALREALLEGFGGMAWLLVVRPGTAASHDARRRTIPS